MGPFGHEVSNYLSAEDIDERREEMHREGDAILLPNRLEQVEREQAEARKRDKEYKDEQLRLNKWMARFTGALVLTAIIAGGVSTYQAKVARQSADAALISAKAAESALEEMKKSSADTHALAEAAKTQAINTGKAVDATVEQSRLDQRAWVGPKFTASIRIVAGEVGVSEVIITNTGRTPALNVWVKATNTVQGIDETPTFNYPERPTARPKFGAISPGDGQKIVVQSVGPVSADLVDQLRNKQRIFRYYGLIHYEDIFGGTHETKFCYSLREDMSTVYPCTTYQGQSAIYSNAN